MEHATAAIPRPNCSRSLDAGMSVRLPPSSAVGHTSPGAICRWAATLSEVFYTSSQLRIQAYLSSRQVRDRFRW